MTREIQSEPATDLLERAVMTARAVDSASILLRPATVIRILQETGGTVMKWWQPSPGQKFIPTFTAADGSVWPITITDDLYPSRQQKTLGAITRGMRSAPPRGNEMHSIPEASAAIPPQQHNAMT